MTRTAAIMISISILAAVAILGCDNPPTPTTGATPEPASAATSTATSVSDAHKVASILDGLEKSGQKYTTIKADIEYTLNDKMAGDIEQRTGWVAYKNAADKEPAKFRVTFKTLRQGDGPKLEDSVDYIFDGAWLTIAKHRLKQINKIQVAEEGKQIEPLRIGKGPFPLPFGQKARDVLEEFNVSTRAATASDPKNSDYLRLTPKKETADGPKLIEMWIDATTSLPVKIFTRDKNRNETTAAFSNTQTGQQVDPAIFKMDKPAGWEQTVQPLDKQK